MEFKENENNHRREFLHGEWGEEGEWLTVSPNEPQCNKTPPKLNLLIQGEWQVTLQQWAKLREVLSDDRVACRLTCVMLVPTLVVLVSHFQFPVSVRKMRKHEKPKFLSYHWTLKDDLQDQACIVNLHIDISANFLSFLLDQCCRDTLPLPSLNNFSCFKDTQ